MAQGNFITVARDDEVPEWSMLGPRRRSNPIELDWRMAPDLVFLDGLPSG
jgi:hypothetical protein